MGKAEQEGEDIPDLNEDENLQVNQQEVQPVDDDDDQDEQQELNVELYDGLMNSINTLWPEFDIDNGFIDFKDFKNIMKSVAKDQGVYDGNQNEADQSTIFFTEQNITHIFEQILEHEKESK